MVEPTIAETTTESTDQSISAPVRPPFVHDIQPNSPSSGWSTGTKTPTNDDLEIYEKHVDDNGHVLTSVKPDEGYEASLRHDAAIAPRRRKTERTSPQEARYSEIPVEDWPAGRSGMGTVCVSVGTSGRLFWDNLTVISASGGLH